MRLNIKYTLTAPLSHIGETSSTGSFFQTVLTKDGKLPVITANSIRGQVRDSGAVHLLDAVGKKVDKDVFHVLFSGGNLSGTMKNDIEKARQVRDKFPIVSVLGGGLGDIIMAGKANFTFAYPICKESADITKIKSAISWQNLIDEMEFTRTDDSKNDKLSSYIDDIGAESTAKASTQMRYSVQYIAAGTEFVQQILLFGNPTNLEKGALLSAIMEWFGHPVLGGMANKGFGFFDADINNGMMSVTNNDIYACDDYMSLINEYDSYLQSNDFTEHFNLLKGAKKNAKGKDKATENNSKAD